ncbi:MAG: zinc ribbon domain-containing protein [Gemmatimonadetes bacterium]|nr:zinc ribbon domain-containing protein [Gemmatimonadota bacterium]
MPTYEYRCPSGHDFENFVLRMSEAASALPCPTCGLEAERRISAGGGLVFKGSGFYITDYGKDGKKDQRARPEGTSSTAEKTGGDAASAPKGDGAGTGSGSGSGSGDGGGSAKPDSGAKGGESPASPAKSKSGKADSSKKAPSAPSSSSGSSDK